jgi:uncharacterized protein YciI
VSAKYVLFYEPSDDVLARAPEHYAAHSARAQQFHDRGVLLMTGTFADAQEHGAMAIFATRDAAEEFVAGDPFYLHHVIRAFEIREWNEIIV